MKAHEVDQVKYIYICIYIYIYVYIYWRYITIYDIVVDSIVFSLSPSNLVDLFTFLYY